MKPLPQSPKAELLAILQDQPADSSHDEILRQLAFHRMVRRGLRDLSRDATVSGETLRDRIKQWQS